METKLAALQNFIAEHKVDINYFYSIHIMLDRITFQGYDNLYSNKLGEKFTEPSEYGNDYNFIAYSFEYQNQQFQILLA